MTFSTENPLRRPEAATSPAPAASPEPALAPASRLVRFLPLSGLLFVVLLLAGGPVLEGSTPSSSASGAAVISFYAQNHLKERAGAILLTLAFAVFLVFVASLRTFWKRVAGLEGPATLALAAAAILVAGQTTGASIAWALTDNPRQFAPAVAQTLNILGNDLILTSTAGVLVFAFTAGAVILRSKRQLPRWLGWFIVVAGIAVVVPGGDLFGYILVLIWSAIVSVLVVRRSGAAA
jgi:hypothetical protein